MHHIAVICIIQIVESLDFLLYKTVFTFDKYILNYNTILAGTPGNRTQRAWITGPNGFEDRGGHQPHNHSQIILNSPHLILLGSIHNDII